MSRRCGSVHRFVPIFGVLVLAACATDDEDEREPEPLRAVDDPIAMDINTRATVSVLANDVGLASAPVVVTLVESPARGVATVDDAGVVSYEPEAMYAGADRLRYQLTDALGATAQADVVIDVRCGPCADGVPMTLRWLPNNPTDMVTGYRLFLGVTEDAATMEQVDDIAVTDPDFDPAEPRRSYDAWNDFRLELGDRACFRLTAYNAVAESDFSNAVCRTVDGTMADVIL